MARTVAGEVRHTRYDGNLRGASRELILVCPIAMAGLITQLNLLLLPRRAPVLRLFPAMLSGALVCGLRCVCRA